MKSTHHLNLIAFAREYGIYAALAFVLALFMVAGTAHAAIISSQLELGDTGSDVSALQTFLARDSSIYPEGLVTGYFGPLTQAAVSRYQSRNGISAVGRVGPVTLASINGNTGTGGSDDVSAPVISGVHVSAGANSATVGWTTSEPVFGRVLYATSWPFAYATAASATGQSGFSSSQAINLNGLQSHATYYYVLESTDVAGNLQWTIGNTFLTQ